MKSKTKRNQRINIQRGTTKSPVCDYAQVSNAGPVCGALGCPMRDGFPKTATRCFPGLHQHMGGVQRRADQNARFYLPGEQGLENRTQAIGKQRFRVDVNAMSSYKTRPSM